MLRRSCSSWYEPSKSNKLATRPRPPNHSMSTILATGGRARGVGGGRCAASCAVEGTNALPVVRTIAPGLPVVRTIAPALPVVRTIAATMRRIIPDHLLGCCGRGWSFDTERHCGQGAWWFWRRGVALEFWKTRNPHPLSSRVLEAYKLGGWTHHRKGGTDTGGGANLLDLCLPNNKPT